ncbi:MAG: hypothetical protein U9R15_06950 [Chloroflexota bacterium]|nr:hypothetical protein [Chloroflexota bacterium]
MEYPYDQNYSPPIPSLKVTLRIPRISTEIGPFPAIVDSGADATLVPTSHLDTLGARAWNEAYLRSQWGERRRVYTYLVDVQVADQILPAIEVVGDDQGNEIVLGRNLLNTLILLMDGPAQTTNVLSRRPRRLTLR